MTKLTLNAMTDYEVAMAMHVCVEEATKNIPNLTHPSPPQVAQNGIHVATT